MSWLTDTLIATGALIALVLILRRLVARWFGPGMAYALWALPLLRLVLPPLVLPAQPGPITIIVTPATVDFFGPIPASEPAVWFFAELAVALWLAGAIGFLGWRVWSYRRMRSRLLEDARPVGEAGAIRLVESPGVPAPVAFGLGDKVIALPPGFMASEDRTARDLAIAHELEHHAGHDIAVNFAMQPLLALHWFNPIAWAGWRALRRDQEAACDARVLAGRCAETRAAYARLIADFAQGQRFALAAPLACPVVGEKSIIHRLRSLTMTEPTPGRRRFGHLLIGAAVVALPLTATITYAANEPVPPALPASPVAPDAPQVHVEKRVVVIEEHVTGDGHTGHLEGARKVAIVDHQDRPEGSDDGLHTRTVTKDGRVYVFKTKKPLSDAEAQAKVAEIENGLPATADAISITPVEGSERRQVRTFVFHRGRGGEKHGAGHGQGHGQGHGEGHGGSTVTAHGSGFAMAQCTEGKPISASAETNSNGSTQSAQVMICSKGADKAATLTELRKARDQVADDSNLSAEIRGKIIERLDAEIERLSKEV